MQIDGWVAVGKFGLVLGSFREDQADAERVAKQILRIIGGPHLLAGFQMMPATLAVKQESASTPDNPQAEE